MTLQALADVQKEFNNNLRKAKALVDILSNCQADQLQADTASCVALMLTESLEAIEKTFNDLSDQASQEAGDGQG